ncbi:hypothetical protein E2542_SST06787 [Spatholobus suberectus]|nr:hypothetical protein E2542_SST06787 [Spatholobus suberectus]
MQMRDEKAPGPTSWGRWRNATVVGEDIEGVRVLSRGKVVVRGLGFGDEEFVVVEIWCEICRYGEEGKSKKGTRVKERGGLSETFCSGALWSERRREEKKKRRRKKKEKNKLPSPEIASCSGAQ